MTDTRPWRLGTQYGIHLYAVNPDGDWDEPIGTVHNPEHGKQIVKEHNSEIAKVLMENDKLTRELRKVTKERDAALRCIRRALTMVDEAIWVDGADAEARCD